MIRSVLTGFEPVTSRTWLNPGPQLWQTSRIRNRKKLKLIWLKKRKSSFFHNKKFFSSSFFRIQDNLEKEERRKNEKELWLEIFDPKKEEEVKQKNKFRSKKNVLNLNSFLFRTRKGHRSGKGPVVPEKKIEGNKYRFGRKKTEECHNCCSFCFPMTIWIFSYKNNQVAELFWKKKKIVKKFDSFRSLTLYLPFPGICLKTLKVSILRLLLWTVINFSWSYFDEGRKPKGRRTCEREFLIVVVVVVDVAAVKRLFWNVWKCLKVRWKTNKSEAKNGIEDHLCRRRPHGLNKNRSI